MVNKEEVFQKKKNLLHRAVTYFEAAPCYELEDVLKLQSLHWPLVQEHDPKKLVPMLEEYENRLAQIRERGDAPERLFLWQEGNMPSCGEYVSNEELRYNHDPDFKPYLIEILVPEDVTPKGALVVCAGGDHGDCTLHEGYQTCLDFRDLGYQCFLLLNRTNHCPYKAVEAGADASRAIRMVRANAVKYRIDENKVAFAGFSNGGLTAEACVQYFSGTQQIRTHFENYVPDQYDEYYGAPDAILNVYGPRWKGTSFDYTNAVYPPTFFAVGREDSAMDNLREVLPDLRAHHVEVEVHTFAGVPHGQSGICIYGETKYENFRHWVPLADAFLDDVYSKSVVKRRPDVLTDKQRYDAFDNGEVLHGKKKNHLPAMGWNSWNAFGSGNTEALTRAMADKMIELGLDRLGYQYLVLDDGCYKPVRVDGKLSNETKKFPGGFRALSDYIHDKGLKFGMYNDIGTNLCAGAAVGTCGHEKTDAASYVEWGVDFLKVDNCYYLWDNATFSDAANAKYVFAPNIKGIRLERGAYSVSLSAADARITGEGAYRKNDYITNIGTFDGTGPAASPVGDRSGEAVYTIHAPESGEYRLYVTYATGCREGVGSWLQVAVGRAEAAKCFYDDFLPSSESEETFVESKAIRVVLTAGDNELRLMNHRRQENTLASYAALLEGLQEAEPDNDILFSICEWGKTQPQNWGKKVGDSWRILNDITFRVGSDGDPGHGSWKEDYTTSVTSQYNKAVIMDEFAGLDKGWNDPDMLLIGMNGMTDVMNKTHMTMWSMMNAPLMLGMDLRRVEKGDAVYSVIANPEIIALNQDPLGVPAKRVATSIPCEAPDKEYLRDNERTDICVKPLADGSVAVSFINVSESDRCDVLSVSAAQIAEKLGLKMVRPENFAGAVSYTIQDLWTGEKWKTSEKLFAAPSLAGCDSVTWKITPEE